MWNKLKCFFGWRNRSDHIGWQDRRCYSLGEPARLTSNYPNVCSVNLWDSMVAHLGYTSFNHVREYLRFSLRSTFYRVLSEEI